MDLSEFIKQPRNSQRNCPVSKKGGTVILLLLLRSFDYLGKQHLQEKLNL